MKDKKTLEEFKKTYPEKFLPPEVIFSHIHAGDRIFIGTVAASLNSWWLSWSTTSTIIPKRSSMRN